MLIGNVVDQNVEHGLIMVSCEVSAKMMNDNLYVRMLGSLLGSTTLTGGYLESW